MKSFCGSASPLLLTPSAGAGSTASGLTTVMGILRTTDGITTMCQLLALLMWHSGNHARLNRAPRCGAAVSVPYTSA